MEKYRMVCMRFLLGIIIMSSLGLKAEETELITHQASSSFELEKYKQQVINHPNLSIPLTKALEFVEELSQFELGRFLLENKGINGYWTAYWLIHGPKRKLDHPLEDWLINKAPAFVSSQERLGIFQREIQSLLKNNMTIASIPCGLMDDLLSLNYDGLNNIELYGIDLDGNSLSQAKENVKNYSNTPACTFIQRNAFNLNMAEHFDLITSNGLNFYERDDAKVTQLYQNFFQSLKTGGVLVTSFLTPPPAMDPHSTWKNFVPEDVVKQKIIFNEIIQANWQALRSEAKTREQLEKVGFSVEKIIYDYQGIFPTIIAIKI